MSHPLVPVAAPPIGVLQPPAPNYGQTTTSQQSFLTVANMLDQVIRQFGDEAAVQVTTTDIIRWINMGLVEIARTNRVWEKTAIITSVVPDFTPIIDPITGATTVDASQYSIPLPSDCVMLQAVSYNGKIIPGFDFEKLMVQVGGNMTVVGTPSCYYMWAGGISFYPYPDTANLNILIYYRGIPPFVSGASDTIPLPDKYFDTLEQFVLSKAYELDEDWTAQGAKKNLFNAGVTSLSEEVDAYAGDFYTITDPIYEIQGGGLF